MAKWLAVMVITLLTSVLGAAGGMPEALKVGFIYVGPVGDYGWSYAHDQGRKYLETTLSDVQTAERPGAYGVGFNADASRFAPTKHLASAIWNWGPYYVEAVKQVRAGTWKSTDEWWPIGTSIVGLSPFGPAVADTLQNLVDQRKQDLMAGRFDVFWGPIKDQSGKLRIAASEKPADEVLLGMNWFVEGVVGTVPK